LLAICRRPLLTETGAAETPAAKDDVAIVLASFGAATHTSISPDLLRGGPGPGA
jgi:hypothetical protein